MASSVLGWIVGPSWVPSGWVRQAWEQSRCQPTFKLASWGENAFEASRRGEMAERSAVNKEISNPFKLFKFLYKVGKRVLVKKKILQTKGRKVVWPELVLHFIDETILGIRQFCWLFSATLGYAFLSNFHANRHGNFHGCRHTSLVVQDD